MLTAPMSEWPVDQAMIYAADTFRAAPAGAPMRDLTCLRCELPLQGEPFQLWTLVSPYPCERGGSHLVSVSAALHVTCIGIDIDQIAECIRARSADCFGL